MTRMTRLFPVAVALALGGALPALAQEPAPPAPPPAPAASETPDSNLAFVGDWDFSAQSRDRTVEGMFRINYAGGRVTGVVATPGQPPVPIRSFVLRNARDFSMTCDLNGETWTFTGRLENPRNISGNLSTRGSIGRLRVQKRAG